MNSQDDLYLTTRELADLLRIKERKVYDLATRGDVPCVRVVGKLLFPRSEIMSWIESSRSGPATVAPSAIPSTVVGSHDPLLDWALRESRSGLAAFFDGSHDGLGRLLLREGVACGTHIHEHDGWNVETVSANYDAQAVVLVEFAKRSRGFIVAPGNPLHIADIHQASKFRMARRQQSAASQQLLQQLLTDADINSKNYCCECARTEDELGMQVFENRVDVSFGLQSVAQGLRLGFVSLLEERYDLLVWRHAWFEPAFQKLIRFTRTHVFADKAESQGGYDVSRVGEVHFNAKQQ